MQADLFSQVWAKIKKGTQTIVQSRIYLSIIMFVLMFSILIGRIFYLQIIHGQDYFDGYKLQIQKTKSIQGTRGKIFDRNGKLLAYNELAYSVTIEDNGEYDSLAEKNKELNQIISRVIDIVEKNENTIINDFDIVLDYDNNYKFVPTTETQIQRFIADVYGKRTIDQLSNEQKNSSATEIIEHLCTDEKSGYGINMKKFTKQEILKLINIRYAIGLNSYQKYLETTIAEDVSDKTVAEIMESLDTLQGVDIKEKSLRRYNDSAVFASIIGYTGQISQEEYNELSKEDQEKYTLNGIVGKSGLEKEMDQYLQGESGEMKIYVNNVGKIIDTEKGTEAKAGNDVSLTLDYDLQVSTYKILEQELAGILLSRIQNVLDYNQSMTTDNTQIIIPIGDVYNSLISNNIISLKYLQSMEVSTTGKEVYTAFSQQKEQVLTDVKGLFSNQKSAAYKDLSKDEQDYITYIVQDLLTTKYQVLMNAEIDKNDEVYKQWRNAESINVYDYLNYAISKNWVDTTKLTTNENHEAYSDSSQIYKDIVAYIMDVIKTDNSFDKIIYKYMIKAGTISGRQLCILLYDQGVFPYDESQYNRLIDGSLHAYDFIRGKIQTLSLTPGQLALEPCSGSAVITQSGTGDVLACVSYPGYDNNRLANTMDSDYYNQLFTDNSMPFYNKATQEATAPGSTYKPLVAVAGLTEGVIDVDSVLPCTGVFEKVTPSPKCWIYPGAHGGETVTGAIADSCNNYFFEVGYRLSMNSDTQQYSSTLGTNTLAKYATEFGLAKTSGIEIPESEPQISDEASVPSSIGQGTNNFTTTQIAKYIDGIATKGSVHDLTLLDKVTDVEGTVIKEFGSGKSHQITTLPENTWSAIHAGMQGVIPNNFTGIFKDLTSSGVTIASKSGTAQQSKVNPDHALYVGFTPVENPEITFAIRMANGYTSTYAAEVASDVLKIYYKTVPAESILTGTAKTLSTNKVSHSD